MEPFGTKLGPNGMLREALKCLLVNAETDLQLCGLFCTMHMAFLLLKLFAPSSSNHHDLIL